LVFGGSYAEDVLMKNDAVTKYLHSESGAEGRQAGSKSNPYVVLLMSNKAVDYRAVC